MESIKELRKKLQAEKLEMRKGIFGYKILRRGVSIYITRALLLTDVTPNQITITALLAGVAGSMALFFGYMWTGFLLLYLNIVLDAVDGEVARYKKIFSLRGAYLDLMNHYAVPGLFFLSLALFVARIFSEPNSAVIAAGALGAMTLPLLRANGDMPSHLFIEIFSTHLDNFSHVPGAGNKTAALFSKRNPLRAVYQFRHFSVMLSVYFLAFLAEYLVFPETIGHPILAPLLVMYSVYLWIYLVREVIGMYFSVEGRVAGIEHFLKGKEQ